MTIKAILIDDEKYALWELEHLLKPHTEIEIAGMFTNPFEALDEIGKLNPQVVFLDINMPQLKGTDVASKILDKSPGTQIVFVTAYNQYAIEAFELHALDYLLKPVSEERMAKSVERILLKIRIPFGYPDKRFEIKCLGPFRMGWADEPPIKWRTKKTMELAAYLLQNRGNEISRDCIIEELWPDTDMESAINQVYSGIYYIRKTIENHGVKKCMLNLTGRYTMTVGSCVEIDSVKLEKAVSNIDDTAISELETCYGGEYFKGEDWLWAYPERERIKVLYIGAVLKLSRKHIETGRYDKCEAALLNVFNHDPYNEETTLLILQLYNMKNEKTKAVQHFKAYKKILQEDLGIEPQGNIIKLYNTIQ